MQPMNDWPNGLIFYTEDDIRIREFLISTISQRLMERMRMLNPAISFIRVETPCLVPASYTDGHIQSGFPVWNVSHGDEKLFLRPETTKGTYELLKTLFPQESQLKKRLPVCVWQSGLSFRVEQDKAFSKLRFKQFYQMEFQLVYAPGTAADYHEHAVKSIRWILNGIYKIYGAIETKEDELPFYSTKTTDVYLFNHEVIAISSRKDFDFPVLEISCGLDRLTALYNQEELQ